MTVADRIQKGLDATGVGPADRILVAVSGGVDSVVLLQTLAGAHHPVVAAHVDHGLRDDSPEDAAFVRGVAASLEVPYEEMRVRVPPGNVQAEARKARYTALTAAAQRSGCPWVATAHTASDQAETVLAAIQRGAGLRGLAGMPPERPLSSDVTLIRPLLAVTRAEVEAGALANGWAWRDDPSNDGPAFLRNRLRTDVMPRLRGESGDEVDRRMAASARVARAALGMVQDHIERIAERPGCVSVPGLRDLDPAVRALVLAEAIAVWTPYAVRSVALVERLADLIEADVGACVESGGLRVWRERGRIRFDVPEAPTPAGVLVATPLDHVPDRFSASPDVELVDAGRIEGRVEVGSWEPGDRIRPLGMDGSQLVSDLLRDRGVPRSDRPRVPVVRVNGEVAWVVGHRLAKFVALRGDTARAVEWAWRWGEEAG